MLCDEENAASFLMRITGMMRLCDTLALRLCAWRDTLERMKQCQFADCCGIPETRVIPAPDPATASVECECAARYRACGLERSPEHARWCPQANAAALASRYPYAWPRFWR